MSSRVVEEGKRPWSKERFQLSVSLAATAAKARAIRRQLSVMVPLSTARPRYR